MLNLQHGILTSRLQTWVIFNRGIGHGVNRLVCMLTVCFFHESSMCVIHEHHVDIVLITPYEC